MVGSGPKSSVGLRFSGGWAKGPKVYSVSICCFFGAQGSFRSTLDGSFPVFSGFLGLLFKYLAFNVFSYQKVFYDFMRPWGPFGYPLCLMQGSCSFLSVQLVLQGGPGVRLSVFGGVFGSPLASPGDQKVKFCMVLCSELYACL